MIEYYEVPVVITHGKLKLGARERKALDAALSQFADGPGSLRIEKQQRQRTHGQNRFWHGIVIPLFAEHCGEHVREMKDTLALALIPKTIKALDGTETIVPGHTSDLTVPEFNDLIKRAQELGASMDIYVPDPNEVAA